MEKIIYWKPCAGLNYTNPPREMGHVGSINVQEGEVHRETNEWLSRTAALDKYPEIIFSGSSTRCQECFDIYIASAQAYLGASQS